MRRGLAALVLAALTLSGCGGSDEPGTTADETPTAGSSAESPDAAQSPDDSEADDDAEGSGQVVEIEIKGDEVEPKGKRVEVAAGKPITLKVESDRPAEFHVHSSPEQELAVDKGESTLRLTIDRPGIVEVEEHESGTVILQLEVR